MKLLRGAVILSAVAFLASAYQANAATYTDATGENFTGAGGGILDIASVDVQNNATDLIFKINLVGDPVATDWGKYMIGIDSVPGGDAAGNGWGRPIALTLGMDYWIGSWADTGHGEQLYKWTGAWNMINAWGAFAGPGATPQFDPGFNITNVPFQVIITVSQASMGLSVGDTISFDVYTSGGGGGDSAVDSLANPAQTIANWGDPYASALQVEYTLVPEPSTLFLVGFGGLMLIGRLFRRRA